MNLENIISQLPYYFGAAGIVFSILALINSVFKGEKENKFNFLSPAVGFIFIAIVLYFVNPFILEFLETLR